MWRRVWWPTLDPGMFTPSHRVVAHEWLTSTSGSDRVAAALAEVTDASVVVCLSAVDDVVAALGLEVPVHQCRIGRWLATGRRWQFALPLMPLIWSAVDVGRAGLLVTSSHSCVNSVPRSPATRVSYCHTPMRYAWEWRMEQGRLPRAARPLMRPGAWLLRRWDRRCSGRVDVFVANSEFVAGRIERCYGRSSTVVHPPIDTDRFVPLERPRRDEFLMAGRAVPYKRTDVAVRAAAASGRSLAVAGHGPDLDRLRGEAPPWVRFVESPSETELLGLMQHARALLLPGIEDFGMVVVEAQACGTPVIVRGAGGAVESTDPAISGPRIGSDDVAEWAAALAGFDPGTLAPDAARRAWACRFSRSEFDRRMVEVFATVGVDVAEVHDDA
jgi:glycosyltransferase involved in cell wall biosynthesis